VMLLFISVSIIPKMSFGDGNYIEGSIEKSDDVHLELCIVPTSEKGSPVDIAPACAGS
jgi:hypothetical protein